MNRVLLLLFKILIHLVSMRLRPLDIYPYVWLG